MSEDPSTSDEAMEKAILASSYIYLVVMLMGVASVLLMAQKMISPVPVSPSRSAWSAGLSVSLTLAYILIGDCLMVWNCFVYLNSSPRRGCVVMEVPRNLQRPKMGGFIPCSSAAYFLCVRLAFTKTHISLPQAFGVLTIINHVTGGFSILVEILWIAFGVATNVVITSIVIAKLLIARREVVKSDMYDQVPQFYQHVIIILVESAAPLALAGLCAIITSAIGLSGVRLRMSAAGFFLFDFVMHMLLLFFALSYPVQWMNKGREENRLPGHLSNLTLASDHETRMHNQDPGAYMKGFQYAYGTSARQPLVVNITEEAVTDLAHDFQGSSVTERYTVILNVRGEIDLVGGLGRKVRLPYLSNTPPFASSLSPSIAPPKRPQELSVVVSTRTESLSKTEGQVDGLGIVL
ncbi:hypothetical protein BKA70DRAFT_1232210 [Coprinopsis sp. MPI-PUGE-AT-0042]|nr:hypothetical protein BKA70DRAFT_1232210 [Coprinopsis sp. MPI-PUGE-AT-0042]